MLILRKLSKYNIHTYGKWYCDQKNAITINTMPVGITRSSANAIFGLSHNYDCIYLYQNSYHYIYDTKLTDMKNNLQIKRYFPDDPYNYGIIEIKFKDYNNFTYRYKIDNSYSKLIEKHSSKLRILLNRSK